MDTRTGLYSIWGEVQPGPLPRLLDALREALERAGVAASNEENESEASLVLYLVSPDYALRHGGPYEFTLDEQGLEQEGCHVFFSSAVRVSRERFRTVGTSRAVALATTAPALETAHARLSGAAASVPVLEWRREVGDAGYLAGLSRLVREPVSAQARSAE